MKPLALASIIALAAATGASARVVTENLTPFDRSETNVEETAEFLGNPVYTADGELVGHISEATTLADGDRMLLVTFEDSFTQDYAGWEFELDNKWETTGQMTVEWTADQLRAWIDANGEQQS